MKLNRFWFGLLLGISPYIIHKAFELAEIERGYTAYGSEIFTILIPILVIMWRNWSIQKIKEEKRRMQNDK